MRPALSLFFLAATISSAAGVIPYQDYILAPTSRVIRPVSIYVQDGPSTSPEALLVSNVGSGQSLVLEAFNASVTYDFGKNIAGWVNFNTTSVNGSAAFTFTESSLWVSSWACDAISGVARDEPLVFNLTETGSYAAPTKMERGAFRYLTVINLGTGNLTVDDLWIQFTAMPHWENLQNYTGWFHSNDEKLNRYALPYQYLVHFSSCPLQGVVCR